MRIMFTCIKCKDNYNHLNGDLEERMCHECLEDTGNLEVLEINIREVVLNMLTYLSDLQQDAQFVIKDTANLCLESWRWD